MKHSGVFDRLKLRVALAAVLALSVVMAGCAGDTAESVTSEDRP